MAASQQLFYCILPPLDRMLREGILMLVRIVKFSLDGCFAATILLYPAQTGQDARGGDPNASMYDEVSLLIVKSPTSNFYQLEQTNLIRTEVVQNKELPLQ